jgi:hypothetical protein
MRYITLSWLDTSLVPTDRIYMMWFATFSLRKWRYNLASSKTYSVNANFISANSYLCAEICAHSLILIILHLSQIKKPELFIPWLFSSQCYEEYFRAAGSCSTFQSSQCNFTCKDFLISNSRKLDALLRLNSEAIKRGVKLPRQSKPFNTLKTKFHIPIELPSLEEMEKTIMLAKLHAQSELSTLGSYSHDKQKFLRWNNFITVFVRFRN